eukprot:s1890_g8.t1
MNGWVDECGLFPKVPLLSATSSLIRFCSELPLSYLFCSFCNRILSFAQPPQRVLQPPAAIPHRARVAMSSRTAFCAAVTIGLASSNCNLAYQERRSITHALLRAAVPMRPPQRLVAMTSQVSDTRAGRSRADSIGMRGPERFFYDRSTYTGTHSKGGPEHVAKGVGSKPDASWKRPSTELEDLGRVTLLSQGQMPSPSCLPDVSVKSPIKPPAGGPRPSSKGPSARPSSRGAGRRMVGPERFFYDRSTYTGTHTRGGPSSVAKGGGTSFDQSWKRPD